MHDSRELSEIDPAECLRRWRAGDAAGFRALVSYYHPLVYAAALRRTGGQHMLAEDAAQTVFVDFARRASGLAAGACLGGWLYQRAVRAAGDLMKSEQRRKRREALADLPAQPASSFADGLPEELAPHLDAALLRLSAGERHAVVLRCMEGLDYRSVGAALHINEDTAQKRVSRALEKLRKLLAGRGFAATGAALAAVFHGDTARAAALPALAGRAAETALTAAAKSTAGSMVWSLYAKAGASGAVLAGVVWAWPLVQAYQAKGQGVTPPPVTAESGSGAARTGFRFPVFSPAGRVEAGLSIEEIVRRIGNLAALPASEMVQRKFTALVDPLSHEQQGAVLQLMLATYTPAALRQVDRHLWRHYLIQGWGVAAPLAAMQYAWNGIPEDPTDPAFDGLTDAMILVAADDEGGISPGICDWMLDRLLEKGANTRTPKGHRLVERLGRSLLHASLLNASPELLRRLVEIDNRYRLRRFRSAPRMATAETQLEALMEVIPSLEAPMDRAEAREGLVAQLASFNLSRAQKMTEKTADPGLRMRYAGLVARPPSEGSPDLSTTAAYQKSLEEKKNLADWWVDQGSAAPHAITTVADAWLHADPAWTLSWLERQQLPEDQLTAWLSGSIRTGVEKLLRGDNAKNGRPALQLLVNALERADPSGAASVLDSLAKSYDGGRKEAEIKSLLKP